MKQEEKTIYDFKKGDIITRIKPLISDEGSIGEKDYSLVGKKLTFMGIANACAYLSKQSDLLMTIITGKEDFTIQLPLDLCESGWAIYIEPDFINGEISVNLDEEDQIRKEIKKAVEADEFERAESLKKRLEEIINKKNN